MIIVGAKGFAKELLEVALETNYKEIYFFDNVTKGTNKNLFGYEILKEENLLQEKLEIDPEFSLGVGGPKNRKNLANLVIGFGGTLCSLISRKSNIGSFDNHFGNGCCIMQGTTITNSVTIGMGSLINLHCTIGHDVNVGDFCELSPGVHLSGRCKIGNGVTIGTNATVLPDVSIGDNCIIGAGALVNRDIPSNSLAVGVPAKVIKSF